MYESKAREGIVHVNGTDLYHVVAGTGRPLLLMHGGLGFDHTYFRPWLDALDGRAQRIYYDHRGNGRSSRASLDNVDHATWCADADALRAHLGHEEVTVLGHSYGGVLALEYALRYSDRVSALILVDTMPVFAHAATVIANAQARGTPEEVAAFGNVLANPPPNDVEMRRTWNIIAPLYFHRPNPPLLAEMDSHMHYSTAAFVRSMGHCLPAFDVRSRLGEIKVPTLVVAGDDDFITPLPLTSEALHAGIVGSQLAVIKDAGHYPFVEQPGPFITAVSNFLDSLPRG